MEFIILGKLYTTHASEQQAKVVTNKLADKVKNIDKSEDADAPPDCSGPN